MQRVVTESGSVYEHDELKSTVRRLEHDPEHYNTISADFEHQHIYAPPTKGERMMGERFITTRVVSVDPIH